ncbi:MAG TPA: hypothetical protein VKB43_11715 [Gaiellaceae bacterium]|nr:hypothetical protein [Gaiellaceae bacterium]
MRTHAPARALALALTAGAAAVAILAGCGGGGSVPASAPTQTRTLHLSFPLGALSAEGMELAATPGAHNPQLGPQQPLHGVLWNASTGHPYALQLPRICADPWGTSLAGSRVATICDDSCCDGVDQRVVVLQPSKAPVTVMHVQSALGAAGGRIDGLAGGDDVLVFNRDSVDKRGGTKTDTLYRIDGVHAHAIATGRYAGRPWAVSHGRILVAPAQSTLAVLRADGRRVARFGTGFADVPVGVPDPSIVFDGRIAYGEDYLETGSLTGVRQDGSTVHPGADCVLGPGATLGGVSGKYLTYITADAVHVIRTSDCRDALIAVGGGFPVGAVLTPAGLFYAFNARPGLGDDLPSLGRIHSTVTFMPMARVRHAVSRGLLARCCVEK